MGLLGTGVICGTFLALDRYDADAKSRDTMHLLDLLDESPLSEGTSKTRNRSLKAIRPPSELALSIRVGLLSRSPIQSLRTSPTTTCRLANGSFIAVDQLLVVNVDSSDSTRYCKGGVVDINGDSYEGSLELIRSDNGWLAVNEVSLETMWPRLWVLKCQVIGMVKRLKHKRWLLAPMPQRISLALHRRLITSETRRDGRCFQGHRA
jgi:hypothetical protein